MKLLSTINKLMVSLLIFSTFLFSSCSKVSSPKNELGGETDIPLAEVGNTFRGGIQYNGEYINAPAYSVEIIDNQDGIEYINLVYDLGAVPQFQAINSLIPDEYKDSEGRLVYTSKVKMTSEGIMDYNNEDGAPFLCVKYDAKVGDTYKLKLKNGKTLKRKVTQRSQTDDFDWILFKIKTITVEQDFSPIPGVSKIVYKFNHKFGLVFAEVTDENGSKYTIWVNPGNY